MRVDPSLRPYSPQPAPWQHVVSRTDLRYNRVPLYHSSQAGNHRSVREHCSFSTKQPLVFSMTIQHQTWADKPVCEGFTPAGNTRQMHLAYHWSALQPWPSRLPGHMTLNSELKLITEIWEHSDKRDSDAARKVVRQISTNPQVSNKLEK